MTGTVTSHAGSLHELINDRAVNRCDSAVVVAVDYVSLKKVHLVLNVVQQLCSLLGSGYSTGPPTLMILRMNSTMYIDWYYIEVA